MKDKTRKVRMTTGRFDMQGHTIARVWRQDMISRLLPFGNFGGGPDLKRVARLMLMHLLGHPLIALRLWIRRFLP
jgi:hypothetical protein